MQVVHCIRVDLSDPDIRLFTTPRASSYVPESRETLTKSVPDVLKQYSLQVVCDANFYSANPGGSDPTGEGIPCEVFGLQISTGTVVSAEAPTDSTTIWYCSLLFSTNKQPLVAFVNRPPGTNTAGIYTAITGYYPLSQTASTLPRPPHRATPIHSSTRFNRAQLTGFPAIIVTCILWPSMAAKADIVTER